MFCTTQTFEDFTTRHFEPEDLIFSEHESSMCEIVYDCESYFSITVGALLLLSGCEILLGCATDLLASKNINGCLENNGCLLSGHSKPTVYSGIFVSKGCLAIPVLA